MLHHFCRLLIFLTALFLAAPVMAHPGIGIVLDSKGNIFYTDLEHVWQITPDGKKRIAVKNVHTHELYLDNQDNLFGDDERYEGEKTDRYHHRIWQRSPNGKVRDVVKKRPGFRDDFGLVRDNQGNQYWISHERTKNFIRKRNAQGKIIALKPNQDLGKVSWLAVSPDGTTLYAASSKGFNSISGTGDVTSLMHNRKEERHALFGIWPGRNGEVYIADYAQNAVKKVGKNGEVSNFIKTAEPWAPTGMVIAPDNTIWLLEYSTSNQARVRKITTGGKQQIF